jgi:CRP/FNR family transcriptional regulator, cyclic AMP receptor protein
MARYSIEALRALLSRHMLFREASPRLLDGLAKFATVRHFEADDEIFAKGDPGNALCGVLMGRVCIYTVSSEGEEAILNILEPGEIFGEIALLDGGPRTASARAMKPVDLLQIHRDHFNPFLHEHPELGVSMLPVLCGRIRMNVEFIEDAVFLHLPARLAKRLLSLAEVHGKPEARGIRIGFRLSQQDLAHMIGATRERVNKELSLWREKGLIAIEDGMIVLCRPDLLKAVLEEEAA